VPEREIEDVWTAIALHTTPGIPEHMRPTIALVTAGVEMDVLGIAYHDFTQQQRDLTHAVAVASGAAWNRSDSWSGADLSPVLDLAARVGADVQVRDVGGSVVRVSPGFAGLPTTHERREAVIVGGRQPGQVIDGRFGSRFARVHDPPPAPAGLACGAAGDRTSSLRSAS